MARVFVIRPFGKKNDSSGKELDFEQVHNTLIEPALKETRLEGGTTGEIVDAGNIREDMFSLILEADLVICDITLNNANVFYELGIRHALRKKRTILIKGTLAKAETPFDLLTDRYFPYDVNNPALNKDDLILTIKSTLMSDRETDSPIFQMLPTLQEADPLTVQAIPLDFREEVGRAQAAKSKGWLRLLSEEVHSRRFKWAGLRLVAAAQLKLKDFEGAKESWESIREIHQDDISANLALANIYERLYRETNKPEHLESSNQAIKRVIANTECSLKHRVEALALRGRNKKTQWRREFESLKKIEERRQHAMNRALLESYDSYWNAFNQDLNHFYSGLAALQMGFIFLDLSKEGKSWKDMFDDDDSAEKHRFKVEKDVKSLKSVVLVSVIAALQRLDENDPERVWAKISRADLNFLSGKHGERITKAYVEAIPRDNLFAWDAAKGQLLLFASLGINRELAEDMIKTIDKRFRVQDIKAHKPLHLVLFAGHRIDTPKRVEPRFPADKEDLAKSLIYDAIERLIDDETQIQGLASAAPGSDLLFHEVCAGLNVPSTLCLPMPSEDFARLVFEELDSWRSRFLDIKNEDNVLELSDREGLPKWLHDATLDPWERGNNWVLKMASASNATKVSLLVLWDGKDKGDALGGTAHMLQLARDTGKMHVNIIDAKKLLK